MLDSNILDRSRRLIKIAFDKRRIMVRVHKAVGSPLTETLAADIKEEASHFIEEITEEVGEKMAHEMHFMERDAQRYDLSSAKHDAIQEVNIEADLYVDSLAADSKNLESVGSETKTIFISHAAEDAMFAGIVKTQIDNVLEKKVDVFVSSIPGTIHPGSDWLDKIIDNLMKNSAFIVLVTPYSEKRPFVWFEIGFSWLRRVNRNCEIYAICAPPTAPGNLPEPLNRLQATSLASEEHTRAFFARLTKQFKLGNLDALKFAQIRDSLPTYLSHVTQSEDIDMSDEAKTLLIEASKDRSGYILKFRSSKGATIQINNKNMVPSQEVRIVAKWESAFNELLENDFIEERGVRGESFAVTHTGYEYADTLKKDAGVLQNMASAGTSASTQEDDDLDFHAKTGTYISEKDGYRYCAKCLNSTPSKRVPLTEHDWGWSCSVCDKSYDNPNYNPPRDAVNHYGPLAF